MDKYFLHQIKHNTGDDKWDKGIVVKDSLDEAKQGYHAYLGAYAYGNSANTDYVQTEVTDILGNRVLFETWPGIKTADELIAKE